MKKTIAALCAGAVLVAGTGSALAHTTKSPTTVFVRAHEDSFSGVSIAYGGVNSPDAACRVNRTVQTRYSDGSGGWTVLDQAKPSRAGWFALFAYTNGQVFVPWTKVGPPGHRHICRSAVTTDFGKTIYFPQ